MQRVIVDPSVVAEILKKARGLGWKAVKLYFMIGLPDTKLRDGRYSKYVRRLHAEALASPSVSVGSSYLSHIPPSSVVRRWIPSWP